MFLFHSFFMKVFIIIYTSLCLLIFAEPLIVAHRGSSAEAPENTLPSFELAWDQGADAIEADFHLTSDGHIVCIHDKDTKRVAKTRKVIKETSLKNLQKIDVGEWKGAQWKGTTIPTLAEVLKTVPIGKKIYIEVKCGTEIIPKLLEELRKSTLKTEQLVIISFDAQVIHKIETQRPEIKTFLLTKISKRFGGIIPSSSVIKTLKEIRTDGVSTKAHSSIDSTYLKKFQHEGFEYHVWTIDDLKTSERFHKMGASSITTNRPSLLKKAQTGK